MKILIVDDNEAVQEIIRDILAERDHNVRLASTVDEAVEKIGSFEPDVVTIEDIPERCYWVVPLSTAVEGGRAEFSTSPFQCACEDITAMPIVTGKPNISLGCFGCRKKTDMAADEMAVGIPYSLIPGFVEHLRKYETGVMTKAKRD